MWQNAVKHYHRNPSFCKKESTKIKDFVGREIEINKNWKVGFSLKVVRFILVDQTKRGPAGVAR